MRCTSPRTVGFLADGKTISWSPRNRSKEFATFQLPCGKCISCRLDYARQWAIRCVHEASCYENNSFITLTYDEAHVPERLDYSHFQLFMKKLRHLQNDPIGYFVTGEYGDKTKRPHWHAVLFNFKPRDSEPKYVNGRGDRVFSSKTLDDTWGMGITEFGSVTFESAGYCARYSAKKLAHGNDAEHEYQPISKKSSLHAIGKKWLEKNWRDVFTHGELVLLRPDGSAVRSSIPRYYEKWLKEHQPHEWLAYVTQAKQRKIDIAQIRSEKDELAWKENFHERRARNQLSDSPLTQNEKREAIIEQKFNNMLQKHLKL